MGKQRPCREEQGKKHNIQKKLQSRKNQVFMEEWLTDYRAKLMKKCRVLLKVRGSLYYGASASTKVSL